MRFKSFLYLALVMGVAVCQPSYAQKSMKSFVDQLMKKMTLEEKLGQLNLPVSGDITTGQALLKLRHCQLSQSRQGRWTF